MYFKKILVSCAVIIWLLTFCQTDVYATEPLVPYEFKGEGTQYDPYLITSYEDICGLRDMVDKGNTFAGVYFRQKADLIFPNGTVWDPIGDLLTGLAFCGEYDGNGHTIANIYCEYSHAGLFSLLGGTVRNLGIESGIFKGDYIGSITSHGTGEAKIINCFNKADVIGKWRAGGICDNCPGQVFFCVNLGSVQGENVGAVTAGICSYGNPQIAYCYDMKNDKLTDESTFSGSIEESALFTTDDGAAMMEQMYGQMWDVYSAGSESAVVINRGNTTFMRWQDGLLCFDSEYEPEIFRAEKEQNKESFQRVYSTRFDFEGEGTQEDPFQISAYEDLCRLRDCVDIGVTYRGYFFDQMEDIVFPDGVNWNPIGSVNLGLAFYGTYDGKGHMISNIYCEDSHAGLFSILNGEVRNLGIESGSMKGDYIGSITSHGGGRIINCYNKAAVCGNYRAGGIADHFGGSILFSWNFGKITAAKEDVRLGGIVSYGAGDIEYCHSTSGNNVVDPLTFNGTLVESDIIEPIQIENTVNGDYEEYARYDGDKIIDFKKIVFLRSEESSLVYDTVFVPKQFKNAKKARLLPEYILLCFSAVLGIVTLVIVCPRRALAN